MTYTPGDYFVVKTSGFAGRVIRELTDGDVNHAGLIVSADGDTVEMSPYGWRFWKGAARAGHVPANATIITPQNDDGSPLTTHQRSVLVTLGAHYREVGTRYNWLGLLALALAQYGLGWLPGVKGKLRDSRDLFCSQLVDDALTLVNVHAFDDGRDPGDVSPADLDNIAEQRNWPRVHQGKIDVRR